MLPKSAYTPWPFLACMIVFLEHDSGKGTLEDGRKALERRGAEGAAVRPAGEGPGGCRGAAELPDDVG